MLALALSAEPNDPQVQSADEILSDMRHEGSWSFVMLESGGRKITFEFGGLGKRVVDLKWALDRRATVGEVKERLDDIYKDGGELGQARDELDGVEGKPAGYSLRKQAFSEMHRAVDALNQGKFSKARGHLALLDSTSQRIPGEERQDYGRAAAALKRAHAILASDDALRRLVAAAERGDFRERERLKMELRAHGKAIGVDLTPFINAAGDVWEAYAALEGSPQPEAGGIGAFVQTVDASEKLVQGRFKRSAYASLFDRMRRLARGLPNKDRGAAVKRLRKHAGMWNKAAANTLAFALLVSLSPDPETRRQRDGLLDQARWKGRQAGRAHALAKQTLKTT